MSIKGQTEIKNAYYKEAMRYMENAKETLKKAGEQDKYYQNVKKVKTACGTAYNGVLVALDGYFILKGVEKKKGRKSIEWYQVNAAKLDKKLNTELHNVYEILHLLGYYDGITYVPVVQEGFDIAYDIINMLEP